MKAGIAWHDEKGRFARLLTLTFIIDDGAQVDNPDDVARCSRLVSKLIQEIRRTHSPRIEYYAVKEATKRGRLHVHLVTTGPYLRKCLREWGGCDGPRGCQTRLEMWRRRELRGRRPRPCVQAIAHRIGFGWIDVRKVNNGRHAASYIAKYLNKQVGAAWPRYSRRASYSAGRLQCETHPSESGRRCCAEAHRTTGFCPPLTIGELSRRASLKGKIWAFSNGHITLDDIDRADTVVFWVYGGRATPPRAPPNIDLSERDLMRRTNRVTDTRIRVSGLKPNDWRDADDIRDLLNTKLTC